MRTFFFVVNPGLEPVLAQELRFWLSSEIPVRFETGGVEADLPVSLGFSLNRVLKVPTRILLRLGAFRCRDFPSLFRRLEKVPWRDYIGAGDIEWHVSAKRSRLNHEGRIEQTCKDAWAKYLKGHQPRASAPRGRLEVYVRIQDDQCTLSVNTSGGDLFRRGYREHVGEAPLRENLAAALLWTLLPDTKSDLFDPMMGSGTFLLEAYHLFREITSREFAYAQFPLSSRLETVRFSAQESPFGQLHGWDTDEKAIATAKLNFEAAQIPEGIFQIRQQDALKVSSRSEQPRCLITNPPYGVRLDLSESSRTRYFHALFESLARLHPSRPFGILLPDESSLLPRTLHVKRSLAFRNGGLPVRFVVFETSRQGL